MTPGRYASPAAFKQALEHRLRERAAGEGVELARLRQLLVFDRFVARVTVGFGTRAVLKGGLAVELRLKRARTTKDIDLRLQEDPEKALENLQRAGRLDLGEYLTFEVQPDPRHPEIDAEGMRYPGRRYRVRGLLAAKAYGSPFGLDVSFAEPFSGEVEEIEGSPLLRFAGVAPAIARVYPLEAHIAEKLHAFTLPRTRPNSRVKDLPDIALLASVRPIAAASLRRSIHGTFSARRTHEQPSAVPRPPDTWRGVYEAMALAEGFRWTTLDRLAQDISAFLDPVLGGFVGMWDPVTWAWKAMPGR